MVYPSAIMAQQKAFVYAGLGAVSVALLLTGAHQAAAQAQRTTAAPHGAGNDQDPGERLRDLRRREPTSRCMSARTA